MTLFHFFLNPLKDYNIKLQATSLYKITMRYSYTDLCHSLLISFSKRLWLPRGHLKIEIRTTEALIGVFGSKGAWPKKGREQGSMNEKFGSLGAHEFFWEVILKILDSPFLTINAVYSSNVY